MGGEVGGGPMADGFEIDGADREGHTYIYM